MKHAATSAVPYSPVHRSMSAPLIQQVPDDLHMALFRSRNERRRRVGPPSVQQHSILLHDAPHLAQVTTLGRLDDGPGVLLLHGCCHAPVGCIRGPTEDTSVCWAGHLRC
jgi:hypothetical protein